MKPSLKLLLATAIILLIGMSGCSGARSTTPAPAPSISSVVPTIATLPTATAASPTPPVAGTSQAGLMIRVWNSMCVQGVPYTLLSVPLDAKVELVVAQAQVPLTSIPLTGLTATPSAIPTVATPAFVGGTAGPAPSGNVTPQSYNGAVVVPETGLGIVPTQNSCTLLGALNGLQMVMCTGPQGSRYTLYARQQNAIQAYQGTLWDCAKAQNTPTPVATLTGGRTAAPTTPATLPATVSPTLVPTLPPTLPATLPPTVPPLATPTP